MSAERGKQKAENARTSHSAEKTPASPLHVPILVAAVLYLVARLALALLIEGPSRTWGIDYARYVIAEPDILIAAILPFVVLIPPVSRFLAGLLSRPASSKSVARLFPLIALIAVGAGMALAWRFRVSFAFLGDSSYYATEIVRILGDADFQPAFMKPSSFLTGHLLRWITLALESPDPYLPFRVVGMAGIAIVIAGMLALLRKEEKPVAILMVATALLCAGSLMFFSYVELYALQYSFVVLYFVAAWRALRDIDSVWLPGIALAASILFGLTSAIFVPSYLLLLHLRFRGTGGKPTLTKSAMLLSALPVAGVVAAYAVSDTGLGGILIPLTAGDDPAGAAHRYTLFSTAHLADLLNVLLLNAGVFSVVLPALLAAGRDRIDWSDPGVLFASTAAVNAMTFLATANTFLGLARDWDLATIPTSAIAFVAVFLLAHLHGRRHLHLTVLVSLLVLSLLTSWYTWTRVNVHLARGDRYSSERLADIVEMDRAWLLPVNTYTALENLRKFYRTENDDRLVLTTLYSMVETGHNLPDSYQKILTMIAPLQDAQRRALEFDRYFQSLAAIAGSDAYRRGGDTFRRTVRELATVAMVQCRLTGLPASVDKALPAFRSAFTEWKEYPLVEVAAGTGLTDVEKSERILAALDDSTSDASLWLFAGRLHGAAGRYDEAVRAYERCLARERSQLPMAYLELARIHHEHLRDTEASIAVLDRCARECPGSETAARAAQIASQLRAARGVR